MSLEKQAAPVEGAAQAGPNRDTITSHDSNESIPQNGSNGNGNLDIDELMGKEPSTLTAEELAAIKGRLNENLRIRDIAGEGAAAASQKLREVIAALDALTERQYQMARVGLAKQHHVTVTTLDEIYAEVHPPKRKRFIPAKQEPELPAGNSIIDAMVERHIGKEAAARESKTRRNMTEAGNAARFIDTFGGEVRYNHTANEWLLWDGRRWATDETGRIGFLVSETLRSIYVEAGGADTEEEREALAKWAIKSERAAIATAVLKLAPSEPAIAVTAEVLDSDPWALNVQNGTLDLRTGQLREHCRTDLLTMLAPVTYDPQARAPLWESFVAEVLPDPEVRQFAQTLAGYCLTGDTTAQIFPVAFGAGQNGKTTYFQTLRDILGDYAGEVSPDVLMVSRFADGGRAATPQIAKTAGKRMIVASESSTGAKLDDALIKLYNGGEKIVARFLHGNPFSFQPTAKLVLFTNHKPRIPATDLGIWRRVRLVPFTVTIPDEKKDEALRGKLREEWPGILSWCLDGLERYREKGLAAPTAIVEATGSYRAAEDVLGAFLAAICQPDPSARSRSSGLFDRYTKWCEAENEKTMTSRSFKAALEERGYRSGHDERGTYFSGLYIRVEDGRLTE